MATSLNEIDEALGKKGPIQIHLQNALKLLSDRKILIFAIQSKNLFQQLRLW
jgi:hypothetical protein